jgi:hypothetical protein
MDDRCAGMFPIMPRQARNHRRSLSPSVDSLEGRKLLSRLAYHVEAPSVPYAESADRYDVHDDSQGQTPSGPSVSTTGPTPGPAEPKRETGGRPQSDPDAYGYGSMGADRSKDDAEYHPGGAPATESAEFIKTPTVTEPDSLSVLASASPGAHPQRDAVRRSDSPPSFPVTGIAAISSGTVGHLPPVPEGDAEPSAESPPAMAESLPRPAPETEPELIREIESPRGAGLISQAQPFPDEILRRTVDDLLDQFEDMGVLDAAGEVMTGRIAALGTACAATFGAIEMARRLHQRDPEGNARRPPSGRMVPGLWPARS